jgi:hypothetical protein
MNPLDQAIQNATKAEATLTADSANLANLQAAVAQATIPVPEAQAQVANDTTAFNASMDALSAAALGSKIPVTGTITTGS